MKVNRRTTLRILTAAAAGATVATAQAPVPAPASPDPEVQSARQDLRDSSQRIARINLPRSTEPAFSFRA